MSSTSEFRSLPATGTAAITISGGVAGPSPAATSATSPSDYSPATSTRQLAPSSSPNANAMMSSSSATAADEDETAYPLGYYDADFSWFGKGDTYAKRAAKLIYPVAMATLNGMEWIGEKVVTGLGLDQSRFQYAVDEFERQERKRLQREQRALDAQIEAYRKRGLEEGMDDVDEDISDIPYAPPINMKQ